ncbi:MAG: uncharacterized protein A8A55_1926 [Amphiamblys sp. WSBS2006]|nr:MAG: uncharacterized protein A8A55_1926 [Amphiamblys sp. WSBS2006]
MRLREYTVRVVTKTRVHENSEVEWFGLYASKEEHVAEILEHDQPVCVGRVKKMSLGGYAVSVITKMRIHEDSVVKSLTLVADEKCFSRILEEGDSSIELGRIRLFGFCVPREIRRKLRYTLVDGKGKEVLGEGNDEREVEENIFLRNKTAMFVLFLAMCFSYYR